MIVEQARLGIDRLAIDQRKSGAFDMRNEETMSPTGNDRDLLSWLAQRGQGFGQNQLSPGIGTTQYLNDTSALQLPGHTAVGRPLELWRKNLCARCGRA